MDKIFANYLLNKTREDYNLIAQDFANKRSFQPPTTTKNLILKYFQIKPNTKMLDWGCGHGRYYPIFKEADYYGIDISLELIKIAQNKYPQVKFIFNESFLSAPFENEFFDYLICFNVIQHIPSFEYREAFIKEIHRVLKNNGLAIIKVWNLNICHLLITFKFRRVWFIIKSYLQKFFHHLPLDKGDVFIPWFNRCERYIHRFSQKELIKLFEKTSFKIIETGNLTTPTKEKDIYLVVQKIISPQ